MTKAQPTPDLSIPAMRIFESLPEDIRAEVIYGKLYILNHPLLYHSLVVMRITHGLLNYVHDHDLGEVISCPIGVYLLNATNVVMPDILFFSNENPRLQLVEKGVFGPPDLHIEVLSPSNRKHDLVRKKKLYEEAGVKEYWIVDPKTKDALGYLLKDGAYQEPLILNSEVNIRIINKSIQF